MTGRRCCHVSLEPTFRSVGVQVVACVYAARTCCRYTVAANSDSRWLAVLRAKPAKGVWFVKYTQVVAVVLVLGSSGLAKPAGPVTCVSQSEKRALTRWLVPLPKQITIDSEVDVAISNVGVKIVGKTNPCQSNAGGHPTGAPGCSTQLCSKNRRMPLHALLP